MFLLNLFIFSFTFTLIRVQRKNARLNEQEHISKVSLFFLGAKKKKVFPAPCSLLTFAVAPARGGCRTNPHHS